MPSKESAAAPAYNALLAGLPARRVRSLLGRGEIVALVPGTALSEAGQWCSSVLFPLSGTILLTSRLESRDCIGVGMLGREGVLGASFSDRIDREAPTGATVLGAGRALRLASAAFRREIEADPVLERRVRRYHHALLRQAVRMVACGHRHETGPRLAQWLLMAFDRSDTRHCSLTHETMAGLLGVRRSSVSQAAAVLQRQQLIRYARGVIQVLDRPGLERASCSCYAVMLDVGQEPPARSTVAGTRRVQPGNEAHP